MGKQWPVVKSLLTVMLKENAAMGLYVSVDAFMMLISYPAFIESRSSFVVANQIINYTQLPTILVTGSQEIENVFAASRVLVMQIVFKQL